MLKRILLLLLCFVSFSLIADVGFANQITSSHSSLQQLAASPLHYQLPIALIIFLGLGILMAFTPCMLPMVPILSGIITQQKNISTVNAFKLSLTYVLSMALTYAVAGVITGLVGANLQIALQQTWIILLVSLLFIVMALPMFGLFEIRMPSVLQNKIQSLSNRQKGGTYVGVAIMGLLSTLILSPCVTAPLVSILAYIAQTGNGFLGGLYLFTLAIGMGIPLLIVGIGQGSVLPKAGKWMHTIKSIYGILMLAMAIWMLNRIVSGHVSLLLSGALLVFTAIYFGALRLQREALTGRLTQAIHFVILIYGVMLMYGGLMGQTHYLTPLQNVGIGSQQHSNVVNQPLFTKVNSIAALNQKLQLAKQENKPVILDFYADWCPDCQVLEHTVFAKTAVRQAMTRFVRLRVDITKQTDAKKAIMLKYHVFGTPAILFLNAKGSDTKAITSIVSANYFIKRANALA